MFRRSVLTVFVAIFAGFSSIGRGHQGASIKDLKTTAEASEFKSTSTYEDVVRFMKAVDAASPNIFYTTYGKTFEGREMPMAVVGTGLKDASAASVRATNRLRVHIQGNIHAGEVEGKESAQILLREFALGQHADWLRTMVFIVTPIYNIDGNEKFGQNRGRQNGPINGMGTRAQAQNINLNRDYMKLDAPEGQASAKLWVDYDPHVGFDLHTSNGSNHAYYLTYSPPLNPNTSDHIMRTMKDEWFPFVTKTVKAKYGWNMFYYGNVEGGGGRGRGGRGAAADPAGRGGAAQQPPPPPPAQPAPPAGPRAWGTFEHIPRFHNNYVGLRNRFALLSEAYSYATFEDRIKATNYFIEEALNFANQNIDRLKQATAAADKEALVGKSLATRAQKKTGGLIEILMGEVEDEKNPVSGATMNRRKNVVNPEQMVDRLWFEPTVTEEVPAEYYIPAAASGSTELLRKHGIQMRQVTAPVRGVEQFVITSNTARPPTGSIDTQQHALRTLEGKWEPAADVTVPAGSWAVPMNQPLARLAFYLIAPTSDDGLVNWNFLDDLLKDAKTYPITRKR
ncbi:MAG TPA: M14 family zinc carboxypeptidase [Vicinamibacterales bacterium]|nr:M14 family zinc carboxypeptidase [Vicinamibacterales bacterium]